MTPVDVLELPDGRLLDFRVSGPADGLPLIFHHGTPGAVNPIRVLERAAHERGLRFVTTSRPGYGGSTRSAERAVSDVVDDTAAVLDSMGADRCLMAGWSGGGPHALACAARLNGAAAALAIASLAPYDADGLHWMAGMGDDNVDEFSAAVEGESTLRPFLDAHRDVLRTVKANDIAASMESLLPAVDKAVLTEDFAEDMADSFHEAMRVSVDGWLDDDLAFAKSWGFHLDEISVPTMIWQGALDLMVPVGHGEWLASNVPHVSAHIIEGEGHLSIGLGAFGQMLDELMIAVHD